MATVCVAPAASAASQLLQGLNRDASYSDGSPPRWAFGWHISGPSFTAAEQAALVLCWVQPAGIEGIASATLPATLSAQQQAYDGELSQPEGDDDSASAESSQADARPQGFASLSRTDPPQAAALQELLVALLDGHTGACEAGTCPGTRLAACGPCGRCPSGGHARAVGPTQVGPGRLISVVGSPFGCLAPFHFLNSTVTGAIACAFPPPHEAAEQPAARFGGPDHPAGALAALAPADAVSPPVPELLAPPSGHCSGARHAGCGLPGPVLYALDAHVFPGMEGALVTCWPPPAAVPPLPQQEDQSHPRLTPQALQAFNGLAAGRHQSECCGSTPYVRGDGRVPASSSENNGSDSVAATAGSSSTGGSSVHAACRGADAWRTGPCYSCGAGQPQAAGRRPLALLCLPLARRADGVQVPLAIAWPAVEDALVGVLYGLVHPQPPADAHAVVRGSSAEAASEPGPPQLQLQPVSCGPGRSGSGYGRGVGTGLSAVSQGPVMVRQAVQHVDGVALRPCAAASLAGLRGAPGPCGCCNAAGCVSPAPAPGACCGPSCGSIVTPAVLEAVELPGWAVQAVVLLRCNGSWATGVLVEDRSGLLITTAHLFGQVGGSGSAGRSGAGGAAAGYDETGRAWSHIVCWARVAYADQEASTGSRSGSLPASGHGGGRGSGGGRPAYRWLRARVLFVWGNHLDLAVLQLEPPYGSRLAAALEAVPPPLAPAAVRAAARARADEEVSPFYASAGASAGVAGLAGSGVAGAGGAGGGEAAGAYGSGSRVWAVGHGLVGPSAEWPPLVSQGCVAQVLRLRCGRPTMVIATTTTHAGGSGGALLDGEGRLVGLVTSNARHAGGATLPNMAFCIAAEELEPVLRWATARAGSQYSDSCRDGRGAREGAGGTAGVPAPAGLLRQPPTVADLAVCDVYDEDAARIWRLQMPALGLPHCELAAVRASDGDGASAASAASATTSTSRAPTSRL